MPKYLIPATGHLIIEADSDEQAEIMALTWGNSLTRRESEARPVANTVSLSSSQNGIIKASSAEVTAVSLSFPHARFLDVTHEIEARSEQAIEKDRDYRERKGLSEMDVKADQLVLFSMQQDLGQS